MIYTIGYSRLTHEDLAEIVRGLDTILIDCRFKPVSRRPGFGGGQLAAALGSRYQAHGHHLGGYGHISADGIEFLRSHLGNLLLLCKEEAPGDCHRHSDICAPYFPDAIHIFRDEMFTARELQRAIDDDDDYELTGSLSNFFSCIPHNLRSSAPL